MPKIHDTRKQKAKELLRRATRGPSISMPWDGSPLTPAEVERSYKLWSETWLLPLLKELVPELRHLTGVL